MYELTVSREFCAAHAIRIGDHLEPVHGHNWRVILTVAGATLDTNGVVCDFHLLERALDAVIRPFHNADLNAMPPFHSLNPTAENVARFIADAVTKALPRGVRLRSVAVTEAPGCVATYRPDAS